MFKRCVLQPAQDELKREADLSFTFVEEKTGRKVSHLIFTIYSLSREASQIDPRIRKILIEEFNLAPWQVVNILTTFEQSDKIWPVITEIRQAPTKSNIGAKAWHFFSTIHGVPKTKI